MAGTYTAPEQSSAPASPSAGNRSLIPASDGWHDLDSNGNYPVIGGILKRVSTQFDKTADTALANITGLSSDLTAGKTYYFEAELYTISNVGGGVKFSVAGTATATAIIYEAVVIDSNVNAAQTRATALAGAVGGVTAVTVAYCKIVGTITVNAAGTLTVQFAQNASNGAASSVLVGSIFKVKQI